MPRIGDSSPGSAALPLVPTATKTQAAAKDVKPVSAGLAAPRQQESHAQPVTSLRTHLAEAIQPEGRPTPAQVADTAPTEQRVTLEPPEGFSQTEFEALERSGSTRAEIEQYRSLGFTDEQTAEFIDAGGSLADAQLYRHRRPQPQKFGERNLAAFGAGRLVVQRARQLGAWAPAVYPATALALSGAPPRLGVLMQLAEGVPGSYLRSEQFGNPSD